MSIYRRGRIWWIKLTANGRRIRESSGTSDKKAAQAFHEKRKGEIWRQAKLGESPPVTWGEAVAKWLRAKPRGMPDRYRIASWKIDPKLTLPLSKELLTRLLDSPAPNTWNRNLSLAVAIHNASGVKPPDLKKASTPPGRTRWLTQEEWARLSICLEEQSPLLRSCAEFSLASGLRENNVLELEWGQVDLRRRVAWLHGDQMKGKVALGIPLNDAALSVLETRKGIHKRWVFGNPDYPLSKASNRAWYAAVKKAKLKGFRWHDLRHTWASWAVMSGVRLEELMKLGGWKSYSMVLRYAHLAPEHMAEAASKIRPVAQNRAQGSLAQR